uniref:Uncharacterized protein n=1 Tax=Arundo donax TaxID=35708 RepID=A0A0A9AWR6_ARUDO
MQEQRGQLRRIGAASPKARGELERSACGDTAKLSSMAIRMH